MRDFHSRRPGRVGLFGLGPPLARAAATACAVTTALVVAIGTVQAEPRATRDWSGGGGFRNVPVPEFEEPVSRYTILEEGGTVYRLERTKRLAEPLGAIDPADSPLRMAVGERGPWIGWSAFPGPRVWRIDPNAPERRRVELLVELPALVLAATPDVVDGSDPVASLRPPDRTDRRIVRVVTDDGLLRVIDTTGRELHASAAAFADVSRAAASDVESDGRVRSGVSDPFEVPAVVRVAPRATLAVFDFNDPRHVVIAAPGAGLRATFDAGQTWVAARGLDGGSGRPTTAFALDVSPIEGRLVWAAATDLTRDGQRGLYRSIDGGRTFEQVELDASRIRLGRGTVLIADPEDPEIVRAIVPGPIEGERRVYDLRVPSGF